MTFEQTNSLPASSGPVQAALELPGGARFYRCALQVNPFAYLKRQNKATTFKSEADYNEAIIEACLETGIEVIGVTDHYRVQDSWGLVQAAREARLWAFSGFEAVAKDGVHFLCLFDPDQDEALERFIGDCGVHDMDACSPTGSLDSTELMKRSKEWSAVCIAAHVASNGGLLKKLSGKTCINAWRSPDLLACALPGPVDDAPQGVKDILKNKNHNYKRMHTVAVINASDVNSPEDVQNESASCFIKMSHVSVEALRQAFLDPASRIRLHSDPPPESHAELLAMTWEGGFLGDTSVRFNENLNVLIGGRGSGKSTMIESIRYALGLDPLGEDASKTHEGFIRNVLKSGTKISMFVQSHKPSKRRYLIERSVPNPPIVKDYSTGEILDIAPRDLIPGVEVFGQHEISELTKSPEKLTLLLERFVKGDSSIPGRKAKLRLELEKSRHRIVAVQREKEVLKERLSALPSLEETEKRFREAGIEEQLKEKSLLVREEHLFSLLEERLQPFHMLYRKLMDFLPIDTVFVSGKTLEGLPNAETLGEIEKIFETLNTDLKAISEQFDKALSQTDGSISKIRSQWDMQRRNIEERYEKLLRELQREKIDGAEFIRIREQIEGLHPLQERSKALERDMAKYGTHRRELLSEWEDIKAYEYRQLEKAANKVSRKLDGRVQVNVTMAGSLDPLEKILRKVGGQLINAFERLRNLGQLSLPEFVQRCRKGKDSLIQHYRFPPGAAERIADAPPELFMRIEELELPPTTKIALNTAVEGESPVWQILDDLSTGQKATAVLLLLLLESDAPLVVDQPEDDLDNRFITEGVVPIMRQEKRRRQFIFATHNANIPVLGDAEQILGLRVSGIAGQGQTRIAQEHMGSIDSGPVRELVEEILEGGRHAFEMRRTKYGF